MILLLQLVLIALALAAIGLLARRFPYPSPVIRGLLPARKRWPEAQIRGWLARGGFHPGYLAFYYRDPARQPPPGDDVLAPADGRVTSADERDGIRYLVIALSFWDMHTQRSPLAGRVRAVAPAGDTWIDGEGRDFAFLRAKICPVQTRIVMDSALGAVAIRLITSIAARRIETWVEPNETLERGQRIGRILLGSTVVLELPAATPLNIDIGQRVRAGETIVAPAVSSRA